jgi:internalin A
LLTGFTVSDKSLGAQLEQMHDKLTRIETGVIRVEGRAAEIADSMRRVLLIVSAEVTDCPRLFTLVPERPSGAKRVRVDRNRYSLTLWCEHPGYWHPWVPATYELDYPAAWFTQISPYARLICKTLQLVVPIAGSMADVLLPPHQSARAQNDLKLMSTLVADLPVPPARELAGAGIGGETGRLTAGEGEALRAIREILFEHDQLRSFGGMRRVLGASGDFLWVCPDHYSEYDPGLPTVPGIVGPDSQ